MTALAEPPTPVAHDHSRGYGMRAFAGRSGVWVQVHGEWCRPLNVWLYRGAWRIHCYRCMTPIRSDSELYDGGYPTQSEAFDVALAHCRDCPEVRS